MKNHIIFKFIAVILCAACLLGTVGSAAGIFVLTQADLYNKTVDQVVAEKIQNDGKSYANILALRHASANLGGCPENMISQSYTAQWFNGSYDPDYYGYSVMDAEGNVVASYNEELKDTADIYTFNPTGQYMYLVSAIPESEKYPFEEDPVIISDGESYVMDAIPAEGAVVVQGVTVTYSNGSEGIAAPDGVGELYRQDNGDVWFEAYEPLNFSEELRHYPITHISFEDMLGETVYEAAGSSVAELFFADSVSGAIVNILIPDPASSEIMDGTPVYQAYFYDLNHEDIYHVRSDEPIGTFFYDENGFATLYIDLFSVAQYSEKGTFKTGYVGGVSLYDADGYEFYDLYSEDGIGFAYRDSNEIIFVAGDPLSAEEPALAEETIPEVAAETLPPETVAEAETGDIAEPAETASGEGTEEAVPEAPAETYSEEYTETGTEEGEPSSASAVPEETGTYEEEDGGEPAETEAPAEATEAPTEPPATEAPTEPEPTAAETTPVETIDLNVEYTMPVLINGKPLDEYGISTTTYYDSEVGETMYAEYVYTPMPEYTVELYIAPGAMRYESAYTVLRLVREHRNDLFPLLGISLLFLAVFAVYLCCAAGRKPKREETRAGGLNCLPLDLYTCLTIFGVMGIIGLGAAGTDYLLRQSLQVSCVFVLAAAFFACLLIVGFCFAFVAQIKTPGGYWWRNTLCFRFINLFIRFGVWLEKFLSLKFFPWLGRMLKKLWKFLCSAVIWLFHLWEKFAHWFARILGSIFRWIGNKIHRFLSLLPLTWQWMLVGTILILISCTLGSNPGFLSVVSWCVCFAIVLYASHAFGTLFESTKRMSKGDLDTKVDDKLLLGCFKDFAGDLNDLADVAVVAAQKQLKSERMKTELITNVSHDIKTPLTSIINYVDLLQKPHTEEEQEQYLEVLDRQSQRLKKLIDDLMDMSKASTGNMTVDITRVDAVESVNQALGEFADKLDKVQLIPVFRHTEESVAMMADGRLVWRVMSNLLSNAVKYAMPGTRLYIDLMQLEGKVVISMKNISRDELNVDADELMERFVRGDDSRNTEGSGLGLNIAKSLMELQKGQLQLLVDGDLFKVTLIFPGA